jgi:intracellular sulfur oxidation DsrE/DsrF family protein
MRLSLVIALAALLGGQLSTPAHADSAPKAKHRVVFDLAVNEPESFATLLRNIKNLRKAFGPGNVEVRVVAYSKGLDLLLLKEGELASQVDELSAEGVGFDACQNTLNAKKAGQADLRPKSVIVDSGVAELVRLQEEGWSYIKVASYQP